MRLLYATDLHGNREAIEQALDFAVREKAQAILFGGDITPKETAIHLLPGKKQEKVLPVKDLWIDQAKGTFTKSLESINRRNNAVGASQYAIQLERTGTLLYPLQNNFYAFSQFLFEQQVLDKLVRYFTAEHPGAKAKTPLFTEDELQVIEDSVVRWLKSYEDQLSKAQQRSLAERYRHGLQIESGTYEELAPSRHVFRCLVLAQNPIIFDPVFDKLQAVIAGEEGEAIKMIRAELKRVNRQLKVSRKYRSVMEPAVFQQLVEMTTTAEVKSKASDIEFVKNGQKEFLTEYFFPLIRSWRASNGDIPVFAMLGNDDHMELISTMETAHAEGTIFHLFNRVADLSPRHQLVGYSPVSSLPDYVGYRDWEQSETSIAAELALLLGKTDPSKRLTWSIHNPPFDCLDKTKEGPVGSKAIRSFLEQTQPALALFGHIHEAARLAGTPFATLGHTYCGNPGAEHEHGVAAFVIDLDSHHSILSRSVLACSA